MPVAIGNGHLRFFGKFSLARPVQASPCQTFSLFHPDSTGILNKESSPRTHARRHHFMHTSTASEAPMRIARFTHAIVFAVSLLSSPLPVTAQGAPAMINKDDAFGKAVKDQVVVISMDLQGKTGAILTLAEAFPSTLDFKFITGYGLDVANAAWKNTNGRRVFIPKDKITQIVVMTEVEAKKVFAEKKKKTPEADCCEMPSHMLLPMPCESWPAYPFPMGVVPSEPLPADGKVLVPSKSIPTPPIWAMPYMPTPTMTPP